MIKNQFSKAMIMTLACFIMLGTITQAQTLRINSKLSTMTIFGTTNIHNFKSNVQLIKGELTVNSAKKVQSLNVEIPVRSIKSGEKLMDNKTYEAFKESKFPTISFSIIDVAALQISGDDINVTVDGNLTIAGITKRISIKATGKNSRPGVYTFKGSVALKMTDFNMKPPTAMLGVMKVGNAITLNYDVTFEGAAIK